MVQQTHEYLFEGVVNTSINSLHAYEVGCFNKGKLNKSLQFGRAFQLGRIGGNFLVVGQCTSIYMPDAPSLPAMLQLHQNLFGVSVLQSIATDKGYYSYDNEQLLIKTGVAAISVSAQARAHFGCTSRNNSLSQFVRNCMTGARVLSRSLAIPSTGGKWGEVG